MQEVKFTNKTSGVYKRDYSFIVDCGKGYSD